MASIGDLGPTRGARGGVNELDKETQSIHSVTIRIHSSEQGNVIGPSVVKDITFWGGLCLLICNTTGPGSVSLPHVAQSAGWIPTLLGFLLVGLLSYLSSLFICEAMTEYPGNDRFQANVSVHSKNDISMVLYDS